MVILEAKKKNKTNYYVISSFSKKLFDRGVEKAYARATWCIHSTVTDGLLISRIR